MAQPTWWKRAAVSSWLAGCCAVGISLLSGARAYATTTMTVETNDAAPGGNLTLTWSLDTTAAISGIQVDIIFDTTQMQLGSCTMDSRLAQQQFIQAQPTYPPAGTPPPAPTPNPYERLRLAVSDAPQYPTASFDSGVLATCTFTVQSTAVVDQVISLSDDRAKYSDANDAEVCYGGANNAQVCSKDADCPGGDCGGLLVVLEPGHVRKPCTSDSDCPPGQACDHTTPTPLCEPVTPTPTPTVTNTPVPPITPTNTAVPPITPTNTPVLPITPTNTPVPPITPTNTPVPPITPTNTPAPITPSITPTPQASVVTKTPTPTFTVTGGPASRDEGGSCMIGASTAAGNHLFWLVPVGLLVLRRRARR